MENKNFGARRPEVLREEVVITAVDATKKNGVVNFFTKNKRTIFIATGAALAAVAGWFAYKKFFAKKDADCCPECGEEQDAE